MNEINKTDIGSLISAELRDPNVNKGLFDIVTAHYSWI